MRKGGYTIIDLQNVAITTGGKGVTIKGVFDRIEGNYNKRLVLSGLNLDGTEYDDMEIVVNVVSDDFQAIINTIVGDGKVDFYVLNVTDEDLVTVEKTTIYSGDEPTE